MTKQVCELCWRSPERCKCQKHCFIEIDTNMLSIIKKLNKKGYVTTYCCEGHVKAERFLYIYISFLKNYGFKMPLNARYNIRSRSMYYRLSEKKSLQEKRDYKKMVMQELKEWVNELPNINERRNVS